MGEWIGKTKLNNNLIKKLKKKGLVFASYPSQPRRWQHPELRTWQPNLNRWRGKCCCWLSGCHMHCYNVREPGRAQDACSAFLKFSRRVPRISTINLLSSWWALDVVASVFFSLLYILPHEWTKWEKSRRSGQASQQLSIKHRSASFHQQAEENTSIHYHPISQIRLRVAGGLGRQSRPVVTNLMGLFLSKFLPFCSSFSEWLKSSRIVTAARCSFSDRIIYRDATGSRRKMGPHHRSLCGFLVRVDPQSSGLCDLWPFIHQRRFLSLSPALLFWLAVLLSVRQLLARCCWRVVIRRLGAIFLGDWWPVSSLKFPKSFE